MHLVTPLAGVWIESYMLLASAETFKVTPLAGVWIESYNIIMLDAALTSHSPCGSVD